ncbi:MAG: hypothetical protein ABJ239_11535 [Erythrobacter sp.]
MMRLEDEENLPEECGLALAFTPVALRGAAAVFFVLDQRLARIVASSSEPMLAQMKLAWWRETLLKPVDERPNGDAVLDAASRHCADNGAGLVALVDGWEHLLEEPPLGEEHALGFANGRSAALSSALNLSDSKQVPAAFVRAVRSWALADLAANVSLEDERAFLIELAKQSEPSNGKLPRKARGVAVLAALGKRSIERGGRPLMEGRGAALVAMRAGLIGT